jgi:hypothetical protein
MGQGLSPEQGILSAPRWIALVVVCLGQLKSIVDATIVNVALPRIQHDLHFTSPRPA